MGRRASKAGSRGTRPLDSILNTLIEILSPTCLILLLVVCWQFKEIHTKDKNYHALFGVLNNHTDAINHFIGVLEGRRAV